MIRKYKFAVGKKEEMVEIDHDDDASAKAIKDKAQDEFVSWVWNNIDAWWREEVEQ